MHQHPEKASVMDNTTVISSSTRNFNKRLGSCSQVCLGGAEQINLFGAELYHYLNFDQITGFEDSGRVRKVLAES